MKLRRLVTGQDEKGRAVVLADDAMLDGLTIDAVSGWELAVLWETPPDAHGPLGGLGPAVAARVPPPGGTQFTIWDLPPAASGANPAGMHGTSSIDYLVVLDGEVTLILADDGGELPLSAGDCLVQGGAVHAWENRSATTCRMAVVVVGVRSDEEGDRS